LLKDNCHSNLLKTRTLIWKSIAYGPITLLMQKSSSTKSLFPQSMVEAICYVGTSESHRSLVTVGSNKLHAKECSVQPLKYGGRINDRSQTYHCSLTVDCCG